MSVRVFVVNGEREQVRDGVYWIVMRVVGETSFRHSSRVAALLIILTRYMPATHRDVRIVVFLWPSNYVFRRFSIHS